MRPRSSLFAVVALLVACPACEFFDQRAGTSSSSGADGGTPPDAAAADAGIKGAGCGIEQKAGVELCVATSKCPNLVVDTQAMPSCGFRIHGASVDLVCACGAAICPMGSFATCAEATQLLSNQTESGVCVQVSEGRCTDTSSPSSTSGDPSNNGNKVCDRQCMKDCGGGAGCAQVCNCS